MKNTLSTKSAFTLASLLLGLALVACGGAPDDGVPPEKEAVGLGTQKPEQPTPAPSIEPTAANPGGQGSMGGTQTFPRPHPPIVEQ